MRILPAAETARQDRAPLDRPGPLRPCRPADDRSGRPHNRARRSPCPSDGSKPGRRPARRRSAASSFAVTGEGVARIRASKMKGREERGEGRLELSPLSHFRIRPRPPPSWPLRPHPPPIAAAFDPRDRRVELHRARRQPRGNGVDQTRQPVLQGDEHAVSGAALAAGRSAGRTLPASGCRIARIRLPDSCSISRKRESVASTLSFSRSAA